MRAISPVLVLCGFVTLVSCIRSDPTVGDQRPEGIAPSSNPNIQRAIDRVYPALVQIWVLNLYEQGGREHKAQGAGSGAIISASGLVVTNYHVAGKTADIRCVLSNREQIPATLVGADPLSDLAVLQLDLSARRDQSPLTVAHFGDSALLKVGDPVLSMGCPRAISQSVTSGIVANVNMTIPREFQGGGTFEIQGEDVGSIVKWIGHDAVIFPGNSGGPLVDLDGQIVGINEISNGLGGAIPSNLAKGVCDQLIAHGKVERSWIGASFQPLLRAEMLKGHDQGVLVAGVLENCPAEGHLKAGDIVLGVNGHQVTVRFSEELPNFQNLILSQPTDKPMVFDIKRGDTPLSVSVQALPRDEARAKEVESKLWGMTLRRITTIESRHMHLKDTNGVLIGSLRTGGPADAAIPSIHEDDVILEVAGKPISTVEDFQSVTDDVTKNAQGMVPVTVRFKRNGEQMMTVAEIGTGTIEDHPLNARHGWLSISTQVLSPKLATALGLKGHMGVRITQVFPGGLAERVGLLVGDVITKIDDQPIEASAPQDSQLFESMVRAYKPDAVVGFTIYRDGSPKIMTVQLSPAPKKDSELRAYEDNVLEFKARDVAYSDRLAKHLDADQNGALVTEVEPGGWAYVGGLQNGDIILSVNGQKVPTTSELFAILAPIEKRKETHIDVFIKRDIITSYIELQPAWPALPAKP